jgi:hypothetical protein
VSGKTKEPVVGLSRCIGVFPEALKAALYAPGLDKSTVFVALDQKQPHVTLTICDKKGNAYVVPCMGESAAIAHVQVKLLRKTPAYTVIATPTFDGVNLFRYWARGEYADRRAAPFIHRGRLMYRFWQSQWDFADILFSRRVSGEFIYDKLWCFDQKPVLRCFKVWETSKSMQMKFAGHLMTLDIETTHSHASVLVVGWEVPWSEFATYRGDMYEPQTEFDRNDPRYEFIYGDNLPSA